MNRRFGGHLNRTRIGLVLAVQSPVLLLSDGGLDFNGSNIGQWAEFNQASFIGLQVDPNFWAEGIHLEANTNRLPRPNLAGLTQRFDKVTLLCWHQVEVLDDRRGINLIDLVRLAGRQSVLFPAADILDFGRQA